jgi:endonuclease-3
MAGNPARTAADIQKIIAVLDQSYPDPRCALDHANPLELLAATILSAQCTDERVNQVTKSLFAKYRTAGDYAQADPETLEADVRPTGFFRNKAKSLKNLGAALVRDHGGDVPRTQEELVRLPGVGRKTANVVLATAFGVPGITVDTHVHRLSRRLGLTAQDDPVKIEFDLMDLIPRERWDRFSLQLIQHGRQICAARKPQCGRCPLKELCPSAVD